MHRLLFAFLFITSLAFAKSEPIPMDRVENGVYTLDGRETKPADHGSRTTYLQTTILAPADSPLAAVRVWLVSQARK